MDTTVTIIENLTTGVNTVWMLLAAMLVFSCSRDLLWLKQVLQEQRIQPIF